MSTLILGGFGFLGAHLAALMPEAERASRKTGLDLAQLEKTRRYLRRRKPALIYHCAAHTGSVHYVSAHAADVLRDNFQMNVTLYEAVRRECPEAVIINPLSNCSYPGEAEIHSETDWLSGPVHTSVASYANSKRAIYFLSECYNKQYGIRSKNFLVPNLFGPLDALDPNRVHALDGMIIRMLQAKREDKEAFEIWGSGRPVREWGYAPDVARVLYQAKDLETDLSPVNIAQQRGHTIRESAETIAALIGFKGKLVFNTNYQDGALVKVLDNRRFNTLFPSFCFTDHKEALARTIAYYEKAHA